jgi:thiol-disulfide isomerase/thioredoxin
MSSSPRPAPALLLAAGLSGLVVAALPPRVLAAAPGAGGSTTPSIGEALNPSSAEQVAVADWLRRRGVIFYGAWWCPACFQQKNLFGKEAGNRLPYVECDKEEAGRQRCVAADVRVFPTWVLEGRRLEGVQTLEELKAWSGFPGAAAPRSAGP